MADIDSIYGEAKNDIITALHAAGLIMKTGNSLEIDSFGCDSAGFIYLHGVPAYFSSVVVPMLVTDEDNISGIIDGFVIKTVVLAVWVGNDAGAVISGDEECRVSEPFDFHCLGPPDRNYGLYPVFLGAVRAFQLTLDSLDFPFQLPVYYF